jgi:hypothetical protein
MKAADAWHEECRGPDLFIIEGKFKYNKIKGEIMKELKFKSEKEKIKGVRKILLSVGNLFGACTFRRKDGSLRKMSYRLHVTSPTYVKKPTGKNRKYRKQNDLKHGILQVFDTNHINYNKKDLMSGRGSFRYINLAGVKRIKANGTIYKILS